MYKGENKISKKAALRFLVVVRQYTIPGVVDHFTRT